MLQSNVKLCTRILTPVTVFVVMSGNNLVLLVVVKF
jgi:hypothetical protein